MRVKHQSVMAMALMIVVLIGASYLRADTGTCGGTSTTLPFTDLPSSNIFFCSIAEAYFSGLTNGTTATTYGPTGNVPREQMAAFVTRTLDQSLKRGSQRAALDQFWKPSPALGPVVGSGPRLVKSDGTDVWVANFGDNTVARVRGSDGKLIGTWSGATNAYGVVVVGLEVFVAGRTNPGSLYELVPSASPGPVTTISLTLGANPTGITYDGRYIWTANVGIGPGTGSVSQCILSAGIINTFSTGFSQPIGILYDGAYLWVTDTGDGTLKKVDESGAVVQTVIVGSNPQFPAFDGTNIWVPNLGDNTITVVRASTGAVLATLSGNSLDSPKSAAFDGERIMVTNSLSTSMWKATDLTPMGVSFILNNPFGVCSDGLSFWVTLAGNGRVMRF